MRRVFAAACAVVVIGCGAGRDASDLPSPPRLAQICAARPEPTARPLVLVLRDNGRVVGATAGATFACWLAAPGAHQIVSDGDDTGPTLVHAHAGGRYWIHQEVSELGGQAHAHLDVVDEDTGRALVDACEERVLVSVRGSSGRAASANA